MDVTNIYGVRTYQALENLYLNLREMQEKEIVKDFRKQDPLAHAKEFGTLKLAGPRQSGHTTAIQTFVKNRVVNAKENWTVLTPKFNMANRILKNLAIDEDHNRKTHNTIEYKNGSIIYCEGIQQFLDSDIKSDIHGIIVDCASFIKQKQLNDLYDIGLEKMKFKEIVSFIFVE